MVSEAVTKGYDGYNLDLELALNGSYADKFISLVNAFKTELAKHNMSLSVDVISANINGTWCSGNNGVFDLTKLQASSIDRVIIEDYGSKLGGPSTSCHKQTASPISCPDNVIGFYDIMCTFMTTEKIVIGLDAVPGGTNPIAGGSVSTMKSYGINKIAVWPDYNSDASGGYAFLDANGIQPAGTTWYALLKGFLQ
jgi:hypothetical protein